jgi:hypothetical protein
METRRNGNEPGRRGESRGGKEGGRPAGQGQRAEQQDGEPNNSQATARKVPGPALSLFRFPPPRDWRLPPAERRPFRSPLPRRPCMRAFGFYAEHRGRQRLLCLRPFCVPGCFRRPECARTRRNDHHATVPFNCCRFCRLEEW